MLIFGTNMTGIIKTKKFLSSTFKMKDMDEVDAILGIYGGYVLCQSHYIEKNLNKLNHLGFKEYNIPFDSHIKLVNNYGRAVAQIEYASAIRSLMYAMIAQDLILHFLFVSLVDTLVT